MGLTVTASTRPVVAIASVVVPAHDEATVIDRLLESLTRDGAPLRVVVACNGCHDDTADRARAHAARSSVVDVTVVDIDRPSKAAALRAAERLDLPLPRLFVDADVVVTSAAAVAVAEALRSGPALAARPPLRYDTEGADVWVRAYYRARSRTPALTSSLWGAGFYGVGEAGRARWGEFPDVGADDLFVDSLFSPAEVTIVDTDPVVVRTPRGVGALLRVLQRVYSPSHRTTDAGAAGSPGAPARSSAGSSGSSLGAVVRANARRPAHAADLVVYVGLSVLARIGLRVMRTRPTWQRDESSR
ncbi:hypothetical protein FHW15_000875 [Terracoccus luteus]|uniref:Glycosyl transferase family 2 n=1 Tax=Terracoccus luteus TaxID=53356 RepID=A0A839PZB5_9MICO|nr:glycosyltransferase [Terracoccus luteus]MBB2985731.1 hypothetical protein [Terracoccus luteus]MCP2171383.1 hypothetical protein [Terracoccus luteus]